MNLMEQLEAALRKKDSEIKRLNLLFAAEIKHSALVQQAADELRSEIERLRKALECLSTAKGTAGQVARAALAATEPQE